MRKDIIEDWHARLLRMQEEAPEFMSLALKVLNGWTPGENVLQTVVAQGLREAYLLGLSRSPVPLPEQEEAPRPRRTRPVVQPKPGPIRRERIQREDPEPEPPTTPNRIRRTR